MAVISELIENFPDRRLVDDVTRIAR